jgi:hypothetical protein
MKKLLLTFLFTLVLSGGVSADKNDLEEKFINPFDPETGFGAKEVGGGQINELLNNGWKVLGITNRGDSYAPVYHLVRKNELIYCVVGSTSVKCFKP